ncbi:hypothetical protein DUNSADRAFT_6271 [Dunaliella salina]|uniref:Uncharacterized protein n=1 Tax=Dunaliella salina TaxID=3046 RepID=A0ABQ7GNL3_DUNSA|nr:hypothetical protein DUNSADRAFT_6271 [Dunaliella salina]|eukprot:KAF5836204.1 hypothetical protein DUNSADRAFT_6271 [Dunaliella salina]
MRRLSIAVLLTRHALSKASFSPAYLSLQDVSFSLAPNLLSLACPCDAHPSSSPRLASSSRGLPTPPRQKAAGNAVLREDGIALADILEQHPDLEEELDAAFRQQPSAQSTGAPGKAAAPQDRTPEAEAAQRAADDLFDTELATRMMQMASQRRDGPTEASTSSTNNTSAGSTYDSLKGTPSVSAGGRRGRVPSHPYAPPYDIYEARRDIEQSLKKMLARAGYYKRDLLDPRSLSLLKPKQLAEVCEDCGIPAPPGTTPAQLAQAVANLVALARQDSSRPPHTSTFIHRPPPGDATAWTAPAQPHAGAQGENFWLPLTWEGLKRNDASSNSTEAGAEDKEGDEDEEEQEEEMEEVEEGSTTTSMVPPPMPSLNGAGDREAPTGRGLRAQVLQEARYRQHVLQLIAAPRKISSWLVAARAQDTVVVYPANGESHTSVLIVATAVSQRHAAACVEAVRWQVSEALKSMSAAASPGSREQGVLSAMSAPPAVGVGVGSDWVALDAGHAEVHVLTPAARAYYQLEASYGQSNSSIDRLQQPHGQARLQRISRRPGATTPALTLDTIRADLSEEPESEAQPGTSHHEGQPKTAAVSMYKNGFHPESSHSGVWEGLRGQASEVESKPTNQGVDEPCAWPEEGSGEQEGFQGKARPGGAGTGGVSLSDERAAQAQAGDESGGRADCQKDGSRNDAAAGARRDMRRPLFEEL